MSQSIDACVAEEFNNQRRDQSHGRHRSVLLPKPHTPGMIDFNRRKQLIQKMNNENAKRISSLYVDKKLSSSA